VDEGVRDTKSQARVVAVAGSLLGIATIFAPSFVAFRPNRIVNGVPESAVSALGVWAWVLLAMWVAAAGLSVTPIPYRWRGLLVGLLGGGAAVVATWRVGVEAGAYLAEKGDVARLSLGGGFWILLLAAYLVVFAASAWTPPGWSRAVVSYLPAAGVVLLLFGGSLASLSIMREYANNSLEFWTQLRLQLFYVLGATALGFIIGMPLGLIAARRPSTEPAIFTALNILEVLPVLAFIGLLNPILTGLSESVPLFATLGIRGVGWAPVLIVLTAYAMYPIARNSYTAMTTLDPAVLDAGRGVGMKRFRLLFEVELPMAAPVILAGLRIALVQTTAGAIIAGLVGGGGLGTFVFLGAAQTATDLILLGTIPIVVMGLFFDRSTLTLQRFLGRWGVTA